MSHLLERICYRDTPFGYIDILYYNRYICRNGECIDKKLYQDLKDKAEEDKSSISMILCRRDPGDRRPREKRNLIETQKKK